jgi:type IV secretory pathway VirB10-like protein
LLHGFTSFWDFVSLIIAPCGHLVKWFLTERRARAGITHPKKQWEEGETRERNPQAPPPPSHPQATARHAHEGNQPPNQQTQKQKRKREKPKQTTQREQAEGNEKKNDGEKKPEGETKRQPRKERQHGKQAQGKKEQQDTKSQLQNTEAWPPPPKGFYKHYYSTLQAKSQVLVCSLLFFAR